MITVGDLETMKTRAEYNGFGYLGHESRSDELDQLVVDCLNTQLVDLDLAYLFLNSRSARFMGDEVAGKNLASQEKIILKYLTKYLPELRKEIRENN